MKTALLFTAAFLSVQLSEAQWVRTNGPSSSIYSFAASVKSMFAGNDNGFIFRSTDNGTAWTVVFTGSGRTDALAISDTNLFAANDVNVFRSTNNGTSWTAAGLTNLGSQALAIFDTNLFAGTFVSGAFRSTNNGSSWTAINTGLTGTSLSIVALFVSGTNLFAGTWGGGALLSTNNGTTWTSVDSGLTSVYVHAFTVSPASGRSGTNLFAGTYGSGVFRSTDSGASWTAASTGLTNHNVRTFALSGTNLFAGTDGGGVFLSTNNGADWTPVNTGLTNTVVNVLAVSPAVGGSGANLFAGTADGVWRRPLSEMITSVGLPLAELPTQFSLKQNYPNPFNPSTTIRYVLPQHRHVTLAVFNMLGQKVATLINGDFDAGSHEVQFNASTLSSGVYFYRLRAGEFVQTRALVLQK